MKRVLMAAIVLALAGCTTAYEERKTPENCACDWFDPVGNQERLT